MSTAELALRLLPIFVCFSLGLVARRHGWLSPAQLLPVFKLALYIGLPSLVLATIPGLSLAAQDLWLPVLIVSCMVLLGGCARIYVGLKGFQAQRAGVAIAGSMIMNVALIYPFVFAGWGAAGVGYLVLVDFGNALVTLTLVYGICCWYGHSQRRVGHLVASFLRFPPFWALVIALTMNLNGWQLPAPLNAALKLLGGAILLLVLVALGVHSHWPPSTNRGVYPVIALRCLGGGLLGLLLAELAGLSGLARVALMMGCAAPVGFNTLVFAGAQGLDRDYAADLVAISLLLSLLYLPLLMLFLGAV